MTIYAKIITLAAILVALATVAPKLVRLRIRFFKWVHWTWAVRVLEEHFESRVLFFRIVLLGLAVVLFLVGEERVVVTTETSQFVVLLVDVRGRSGFATPSRPA